MTKPVTTSDRPAPAPDQTGAEADRGTALARVSDAYAGARDKAASAIATIEGNPLVALLSGLALGAAAGALLPRSSREKALLAPFGERLAAAAEAAIAAGREAGSQALAEGDLSIESLREQVAALVGQAGQAAGAIGTAALDAARRSAGV